MIVALLLLLSERVILLVFDVGGVTPQGQGSAARSKHTLLQLEKIERLLW
jgi:hypothetical protein